MKLFNFTSRNFKIIFAALLLLCIVGICMGVVSAIDTNAINGGSSVNNGHISIGSSSNVNGMVPSRYSMLLKQGHTNSVHTINEEPVLGLPNIVVTLDREKK